MAAYPKAMFLASLLLLALSGAGAAQIETGRTSVDALVFRGTVTAITNAPIPNSKSNWIVTMHVARVEKGRFTGTHFSFRIHSPSKSGLMIKREYRVEAKLTQDGYVVDEFQWMK